jgi:hypothetical protein
MYISLNIVTQIFLLSVCGYSLNYLYLITHPHIHKYIISNAVQPVVYDAIFMPNFTNHFTITLLHVISGCIWLFTGSIILLQCIPAKYHKFYGYVYFYSATITTFTAVYMLWNIFTTWYDDFLGRTIYIMWWFYTYYSLRNALKYAKERNINLHRKWVIRSYGAGLVSFWQRIFLFIFLNTARYVINYNIDVLLYKDMYTLAGVCSTFMGIIIIWRYT